MEATVEVEKVEEADPEVSCIGLIMEEVNSMCIYRDGLKLNRKYGVSSLSQNIIRSYHSDAQLQQPNYAPE